MTFHLNIIFNFSLYFFKQTKQNKLMRLIRFMLTVGSGFSKCFKMQMFIINLSPVSLSNKKVNIYTCPRLTFLKKNATENAYKSISEPLKISKFSGRAHPPSGSRFPHSILPSSCSEVWLRPWKVIWKENLHLHCSTDQNSLDRNFFQEASNMVATEQEIYAQGKKFLKVRGKSEKFTSSQRKF